MSSTEDDYFENRRKMLEDCDRMGREFVKALKERTGDEDVVGIPEAIAAAFDELTQGSVDISSFMLPASIDRFMGIRLARYAPGIEKLWNRLIEAGADCYDKRVNNGGDYYVYAKKPSRYWRYVLICVTQNRYFTVLMRYGSNPKNHPSDLDEEDFKGDEKYRRIVSNLYQPEIFIVQEKSINCSSKQHQRMEAYSKCSEDDLPSWQDDYSWDGYVAHLKEGKVDRGHLYYDKASYCLYSLVSFIDCVDEMLEE